MGLDFVALDGEEMSTFVLVLIAHTSPTPIQTLPAVAGRVVAAAGSPGEPGLRVAAVAAGRRLPVAAFRVGARRVAAGRLNGARDRRGAGGAAAKVGRGGGAAPPRLQAVAQPHPQGPRRVTKFGYSI